MRKGATIMVAGARGMVGSAIVRRPEGDLEVGVVAAVSGDKARCKVGDVILKVDPRYYRPTEVDTLLGDPSKAKQRLGWVPKITLPELVKEMVNADYESAKRDRVVKRAGFQAFDDYHE